MIAEITFTETLGHDWEWKIRLRSGGAPINIHSDNLYTTLRAARRAVRNFFWKWHKKNRPTSYGVHIEGIETCRECDGIKSRDRTFVATNIIEIVTL